jgi:hypothetical protein
MKQVQYRRAAQSSGFRPVQISGNEIARMREESARVVQGMREQRNAEIKDREAQLAQEKESQALERRLREKNRQIETANHQRELTGLQQEARASQAQYEQNQRDNAQILKGLTALSDSAGKAYKQYVEAEEDEQIAQNVLDYRNNKAERDYEALVNELILDENDEQQQALGDEYVANGGDPLVPAKRRNQSDRVRRESLKAQAAFFYQYKYPQLLQEAIRAQEEKLGRKMDASELSAYMVDVSRIVSEKFRTEGGMSLKPSSMRTALEFEERHHQSLLATARSDQLQRENQQAADTATTILTQNPTEFANNIASSFRTIYRVNGWDYAKAHTWYTSLATMRGPDGNRLFTLEQLGSVVLQKGQKPYAKEFPGRFEALRQAVVKADNDYRSLAIKSENLAFKEAEQQTLEYIAENNTQDVVDAAVGYFTKTYGKVPESITKFQENYTLEAEAKAQQIKNIQALAIDGFIQKEHVEALKRLDVKAGRELEERYNLQEARYRTGAYKKLSDAFKTTANGVTTYGSQKPNSAASLALQRGMRAEFRRRVDQAVAGGADFNTSAELIAKEIENEVTKGARDPSSLWYRKPSGPGGAAEFPNLYSKDGLSKFEAARRSFQAIQQNIQDNGIAKTLDTAESILTRDEIVSIIGGYGKPGFTIPTDVLAVSGLGNGLDPFTIINRQIEALGDPNLQPLEPPAIIRSANESLTEQQRKDLFTAINGPRQRLRALQQVAGTVARPSNLRAGFAQDSLKRSYTDALTYDGNKGAYQHAGTTLQELGFTVTEHPAFGGVDPVHAGNSFHGYGEAFDIKHMTGDYQESIDKTERLKELIRSMGLFKEVIGPGDWDPNAEQTPEQLLYKKHQFHLHLGGLMRPLTAEDIEKLNSFK